MATKAVNREIICRLAALVAVAVAFFVAVALTGPAYFKQHDGDLHLFYQASLKVISGELPYRDFAYEYPPLALVPMLIPRLLGGAAMSKAAYVWALVATNMLQAMACVVLVQRLARACRGGAATDTPSPAAAMLWAAGLFAMGSVLAPYRFDLFPTLLTTAAVLSMIRRRATLAGVLLGLGVAAKLYPVVLVPLAVVYFAARRDYANAWRAGLAAILVPTLIGVVTLACAGSAATSFLTYHKMRGLQLESLWAGSIEAAKVLGLVPARGRLNYGAVHIQSPWAPAMLALQPLVAAGALAWSYRLTWQALRRADGADEHARLVVRFSAAALAIFIITSKVFSPQYLVWITPLVAVCGLRPRVMLVAAWGMTTFLFPFFYTALMHLEPLAVLMLNLRNATVLLLAWRLVMGMRAGSPRAVTFSDAARATYGERFRARAGICP